MEKIEFSQHKARPTGKITFEQFLAWADEDTHAEWEDGEIIVASPASITHQELSGWLTVILRTYVRQKGLGQLLTAPFLVRLQVSQQGREPDLIFVKTANLEALQATYFEGAPDLIVEIVSPESVSRDRGRKFVEYESEGVPEYWLLDPIRRQAEFYRLNDEGHYGLALPDTQGIYHSRSIAGFWLKVEWLWQSPLPDELAVLQKLDIL